MSKILKFNHGKDCPYNYDEYGLCHHSEMGEEDCWEEIPKKCPLEDYPDTKPQDEYHWT